MVKAVTFRTHAWDVCPITTDCLSLHISEHWAIQKEVFCRNLRILGELGIEELQLCTVCENNVFYLTITPYTQNNDLWK